jgi:hypothetical protein
MLSLGKSVSNVRSARTTRGAITCIAIIAFVGFPKAFAERLVIPLDGTWAIGESVGADDMPEQFLHAVAVPGLVSQARPLVSQARPPFAEVNQYATEERLQAWSKQLTDFDPTIRSGSATRFAVHGEELDPPTCSTWNSTRLGTSSSAMPDISQKGRAMVRPLSLNSSG